MTEKLQKKAEDFIIDRYKIAECYREDNAETREYMRMDIHSQYEDEYQLYLDATRELEKENEELKEKYDTCLRENTGLKIHSAYVEKKLAKAKEIIKKISGFIQTFGCGPSTDKLVAEAQQFLKESE